MNTIIQVRIGKLLFLQTSTIFIALTPCDEYVDFDFKVFSGGLMVGAGWIECGLIRFGSGERMADEITQDVTATIRMCLPELFKKEAEEFEDIDLDHPTKRQLLLAAGPAAACTSGWRSAN